MDLIIKKIQKDNKEDLENVLNVYQANLNYFKLCGTEDVAIDTVLEDFNAIPEGVNENQNNFLLFFENNKPIAIMNYLVNFPNENAFYIGLLMIDGNEQGKGIGRKIYKYIESQMINEGMGRGQLGVLSNNDSALKFWEEMGYSKIKTVLSSVRPDKNWEVHVMEKIIK